MHGHPINESLELGVAADKANGIKLVEQKNQDQSRISVLFRAAKLSKWKSQSKQTRNFGSTNITGKAIHHAEQRIAQLEEAEIDNPKK